MNLQKYDSVFESAFDDEEENASQETYVKQLKEHLRASH